MTTRPAPPTKARKHLKTHPLQARITEELRGALEAEAERTGRSLSQVAELWMERARLGRASANALLSDAQDADGRPGDPIPGLGAALRLFKDFAFQVRNEIGDPSASGAANRALATGWALLALRALPKVKADDDDKKHARYVADVRALAGQIIRAAVKAGEADRGGEAIDALLERPQVSRNALLGGGTQIGLSAIELLQHIATLSELFPDPRPIARDAATRITELQAAGKLDAAADVANDFPDMLASFVSRVREMTEHKRAVDEAAARATDAALALVGFSELAASAPRLPGGLTGMGSDKP